MTTTTKNVLDTLKSAIILKTWTEDGVSKSKYIQQPLKASNFPDRRTYAKYVDNCNLFIRDVAAYLNAAKDSDNTPSKKALLDRLNAISAYLKYEGVKMEDAPITFKNYHINFILNHALTLKIQQDNNGTIADIVKSETAIRRLIEQCFYYTLNAMPLPSVKLSEKSENRMAELNRKVKEAEQKDSMPKAEKPKAKQGTKKTDKAPEVKEETAA